MRYAHFVAIAINTNVNSLLLNRYISLPTSANLFLEEKEKLEGFRSPLRAGALNKQSL